MPVMADRPRDRRRELPRLLEGNGVERLELAGRVAAVDQYPLHQVVASVRLKRIGRLAAREAFLQRLTRGGRVARGGIDHRHRVLVGVHLEERGEGIGLAAADPPAEDLDVARRSRWGARAGAAARTQRYNRRR